MGEFKNGLLNGFHDGGLGYRRIARHINLKNIKTNGDKYVGEYKDDLSHYR